MFENINVDYDTLDSKVIDDMITIIKKQEDSRYASNIKHKMEDVVLITLFVVLAKCNK